MLFFQFQLTVSVRSRFAVKMILDYDPWTCSRLLSSRSRRTSPSTIILVAQTSTSHLYMNYFSKKNCINFPWPIDCFSIFLMSMSSYSMSHDMHLSKNSSSQDVNLSFKYLKSLYNQIFRLLLIFNSQN